jgi:hypothetical protein
MSQDDSPQGQQHQRQQQQRQQSRQQQQRQPTNGAQAQQPQTASVPLLDGESILIDARPAWSAYAYYFLFAALILIGGLAAGGSQTIAAAVLAAIIVGYVWYKRRGIRYVVTDRRMMVVTGHSSRMTNEAWMVDIKNLKTGASFLERLLGHGHISVDSDITSSGFGRFTGMTFGGIDNHGQIAQIIRERQNNAKMD